MSQIYQSENKVNKMQLVWCLGLNQELVCEVNIGPQEVIQNTGDRQTEHWRYPCLSSTQIPKTVAERNWEWISFSVYIVYETGFQEKGDAVGPNSFQRMLNLAVVGK